MKSDHQLYKTLPGVVDVEGPRGGEAVCEVDGGHVGRWL